MDEIENTCADGYMCCNCRFFEERSGFCRRNPPVPVALNGKSGPYYMTMYPKIQNPRIDWCNEFSPKD